jgi:hypothetical protein
MIDGNMRNYVVQLGVPICRTAAPCFFESSSSPTNYYDFSTKLQKDVSLATRAT